MLIFVVKCLGPKLPGPKIRCLLLTRNVFNEAGGRPYFSCQRHFWAWLGYGFCQLCTSHVEISCRASSLKRNLFAEGFLGADFRRGILGNGMNLHVHCGCLSGCFGAGAGGLGMALFSGSGSVNETRGWSAVKSRKIGSGRSSRAYQFILI